MSGKAAGRKPELSGYRDSVYNLDGQRLAGI